MDSHMGKPLTQAFPSTLTGQMVLALSSSLVIRADNSILEDCVAFDYNELLTYIRHKLGLKSSISCLRHHLEPAERALDLHRQLA
jgi:hypothetical protein